MRGHRRSGDVSLLATRSADHFEVLIIRTVGVLVVGPLEMHSLTCFVDSITKGFVAEFPLSVCGLTKLMRDTFCIRPRYDIRCCV